MGLLFIVNSILHNTYPIIHMTISLIAAASENNVIGRDNDLPWHLPKDLKFFRSKTSGHPIIMGRKNYESIGRSLPNRLNIVITRQAGLEIEGCEVVGSLEEAIELGKQSDQDELFVIGGGQIYEAAMPLADRIYLTRVHAHVDGDVLFPELDESEWKQLSSEEHLADDDHEHAFTFIVYERR